MLRTASFLRVALFLLVLLMLPAGSLYAQKKKQFTVVLDAGHGGNDPGAVHGKVKEKDINLTVTKMLAEKIKKKYPEVKVVFTRSTDVFVTLEGRSDKANKEKASAAVWFPRSLRSVAHPSRRRMACSRRQMRWRAILSLITRSSISSCASSSVSTPFAMSFSI